MALVLDELLLAVCLDLVELVQKGSPAVGAGPHPATFGSFLFGERRGCERPPWCKDRRDARFCGGPFAGQRRLGLGLGFGHRGADVWELRDKASWPTGCRFGGDRGVASARLFFAPNVNTLRQSQRSTGVSRRAAVAACFRPSFCKSSLSAYVACIMAVPPGNVKKSVRDATPCLGSYLAKR